ncbi:hypothetical protein BMS3Bbin13_00075 [bacterium BMS3Bbin13]|nr:hypothetical protein BMS3Bbin13_00075 [bacterium BMS3Bbin13]
MKTNMRIPFDTLAYTNTLRKAGIDEACANAHAEALIMAFTQGVATHEDIKDLDSKMTVEFVKVRSEMSEEFTKVRSEMSEGFTKVRSEMSEEFTKVRSGMSEEFTKVRSGMAEGFTKVHSEMDRKFDTMRFLMIATLVIVAITNPIALHILHLSKFLLH